MMERMTKGVFTLRDMREQFQSVMKMGNLSQVVSMIPGMSQLMPQGSEKDGANRIQMFMVAMDSMTDDELDGIFKHRDRATGKITMEKQVPLWLLWLHVSCAAALLRAHLAATLTRRGFGFGQRSGLAASTHQHASCLP